jgi:hypothetical protein
MNFSLFSLVKTFLICPIDCEEKVLQELMENEGWNI